MSSPKGKLELVLGVLFPVKQVLMGIYGPEMDEPGEEGERDGESNAGSWGRLCRGVGGVADGVGEM